MNDAQITRQRNKAARDAQRAAREAQEKQDRALVLDALRAVLSDTEATTEQRLYAVAVLDNMKHYCFVPYGVRHAGEVDIAAFADALKKQEEQHG